MKKLGQKSILNGKFIQDGSIIEFNVNKIKLKQYILSLFNENSIQDLISNHSSNFIYEKIYQNLKNSNFQDIYYKIIKIVSFALRSTDLYFQKIPSFRIHRINQKSVNYHNDVWYGHGEKVINFWIPISNTNKQNTLWLSKYKDSLELNKKFKEEQLSILDVNKLAKKISSPQILKYGEILCFNTATFHGTTINSSNKHRLSFDFRILKKNSSPGTKPINEFYKSYKSKNITKKKCIAYIYKRNPILKNLSHSVQRNIIKSFCQNNFLEILIEETEIYGVDHYPQLFYYIINSKLKNIVMTSVLCLPDDKNLRRKLIKKVIFHKKNLFFALENKKFSGMNFKEIDNYFKNYL